MIAEEFSSWQDSWRSIDLLCIGKDSRIVVVELKRDNRGGEMELQAIRYAAMVSNMTFEQILDAHERYLAQRGIQENARERISSHLESDGIEEPEISSERPRIILASGDFSKELTTSVLWLNNVGLDIKCIRLKPYKYRDEIIVDVSQVIPLPEAEEFLVKVRERASESDRQRQSRGTLVKGAEAFLGTLRDLPDEQRNKLEKLGEWSIALESDGLANLYTNKGPYFVTLSPRIPAEGVGLVTIV